MDDQPRTTESASSTGALGFPPRWEALPAADGLTVPAARRGSETVLVVEDEHAVRAFATAVLQRAGYVVREAEDGLDALRRTEVYAGPIHLLVTDVIMPRLGGLALAERLQAVRPGLKVLYISGYADDALARQGIQAGEVVFLPKPFTPDSLALKVRALLDA